MNIETGFGERVREVRTERELTQRQLAEKLRLDASAISRIEQGTRAVRLGEAALIAKALNIDLEYLVYGDLDPVAALRRYRSEADEQMHTLREAALEMATAFYAVTDVLEDHPGLFANLDDELPAGDLPQTVDEYLSWVLSRIKSVFRLPDESRRLVVKSERRATQLMDLLRATIDGTVSTVPFPETTPGLGRRLASLIPTPDRDPHTSGGGSQ